MCVRERVRECESASVYLLSHTLTNSHNSIPWDLQFFDTSTFVNLAINNINPAGYREFYPVPVLGELAHVKEREHKKCVDKPSKSAKYLRSGTRVPRHAWRSTHVCMAAGCRVKFWISTRAEEYDTADRSAMLLPMAEILRSWTVERVLNQGSFNAMPCPSRRC